MIKDKRTMEAEIA